MGFKMRFRRGKGFLKHGGLYSKGNGAFALRVRRILDTVHSVFSEKD